MPEHPELRAPWSRSERRIPRTVVRPLQQFLGASTSSGYVLVVAAGIALVWANSPWSASYESVKNTTIGPHFWHLDLSLAHWAADFLLACWRSLLWRLTGQSIFFIAVGFDGREYEELQDAVGRS